jgi:hypothetical protein
VRRGGPRPSCRPGTPLPWWTGIVGWSPTQGALANLDHAVGRGSIANILRDHGLEPAPERLKKTTWTEFLKTHWDVLAAKDFFTVDVWTGRGLTRFAVLFFIDLSTRRVEIAGLTAEADAVWMSQVSRNITDASDGFLTGKRCLIRDRDEGNRCQPYCDGAVSGDDRAREAASALDRRHHAVRKLAPRR